MNRKKIIALFFICFFLVVSSIGVQAAQKVLSISMSTQEYNQWCWDACSQCVLRYKGYSRTQTQLATYLFGYPANQPATMDQIVYVLRGNGYPGANQTGRLSYANCVYLINNNKPYIIGRNGHATVGYGFSDSGQYIAIADPWPGVGNKWQTYSYYSSGWVGTAY